MKMRCFVKQKYKESAYNSLAELIAFYEIINEKMGVWEIWDS
jgi:hypothetical protein